MHMLQQADVIIYAGSLVNPELLQYAKTDCEIHNSAKLTLEEVLQIMQEAQEQGKMLVRLHTGEPSIYGAVRRRKSSLAPGYSGSMTASCRPRTQKRSLMEIWASSGILRTLTRVKKSAWILALAEHWNTA
jgi:hypothetical protein